MITKRQLGLGTSIASVLAAVAVLAIDYLKAGNFEGIGPVQQVALLAAGLLFLLGLSLIPLGDRPA